MQKEYFWSTTGVFKAKYSLPSQATFPQLFLIDSISKCELAFDVQDVDIVYKKSSDTRPRPLYPSTLLELGLSGVDSHVPSLAAACVAAKDTVRVKKVIEGWLREPPSPENAQRIRDVVKTLQSSVMALPKVKTLDSKKFLPLLQRRKLSINACHELGKLVAHVSALSKHDFFEPLFLLSASSLGIDNIDLNYFKKTLVCISKLFNSLLAPIEQLEKKATLEQWNLDNCSFAHGLNFSNFQKEVDSVRAAFLEHFDSFPSSTVLKDNKLTIEVSKSLNRLYICSTRKGSNTCLLYTSPSPRDAHESRMPSSA